MTAAQGSNSSQTSLCKNCGHRLDSDETELEASRSKFSDTISNILNSNEPPPLDEIDSMRRCLSAHERAARNVEEEITRTKKYLQSLKAERRELEGYIKDQRAILNPIRRIPHELLSHIFSMCVEHAPMTHSTVFRNSLAADRIEWTLTHVCSQWRSVALALSSDFWSKAHIRLDSTSSRFGGHAMLLGLRLRRSSGKPLSIFIKRGNLDASSTEHSLLATLLLYNDQWSGLRVDLKSTELQTLLSAVKPPLPALGTLIFRHPKQDDPNPREEEVEESLCDIFRNAPSLRDVSLEHFRNPLKIPLPYHQLVSLSFAIAGNSFKISQLLSVLRLSERLERLYVGYHFIEEENPDDLGSVVRLPSLEAMEMYWDYVNTTIEEVYRGGNQLVNWLILPELNNFWDEGDGATAGSVSLDCIASLHERSGRALTGLRITVSDTDEEIARSLKGHAALTSLGIVKVGGSFTKQIFEALKIREEESERLLPKLEELTLQGSMAFDAVSLVEMVESRWQLSETGFSEVSCPSRLELDCDAKEIPTNIPYAFARFSEDCFKSLNWVFSA